MFSFQLQLTQYIIRSSAFQVAADKTGNFVSYFLICARASSIFYLIMRERESNHLIFHHFLFRSSIIHSVLRAFFLPFRFQIKNRQKQHQRGKKRKWWKKKVKMNWRVYEGERFIIKFKEPKQACTRCWAKDKSGQTESHIRERVSARALK